MQPIPAEEQLPACLAMLRQNRVDEAAEIASTMVRERPQDAQTRFATALVDRHRGKTAGALASLERLTNELPQNPLIRLEYASTLVMTGQPDKAVPILQAMSAASPGQVLPRFWLGQAHLRASRATEAVECFEQLRQMAPQNKQVIQPLAAAYLATGRPGNAEKLLREHLEAHPEDIESQSTLAAALEQQNRLGDAVPVFEKMLQVVPGHPGATAGLARALQTEGKKDQARDLLRPAFEADNPEPVVVSTFAGLCETPEDRAACLEKAKALLASGSAAGMVRASLCFAAGRLLDAQGDHRNAFAAFSQGNAASPKLYDAAMRTQFADDLIATFSAETMKSLPRAKGSSNRPIFILGMPRSGTTLVEQILAAHPDVYAAGELAAMRRIWRELVSTRGQGQVTPFAGLTQIDVNNAADQYLKHIDSLDAKAKRVTDKMPPNFEQLALINLCFPNARVIHCSRNPLDTCLSCYFTQLGPAYSYSNDLSTLGHAYAQYHRLMAHWRSVLDIPMLDVVYEDLVADLEGHARRIVEHAGLDWDDRCLRFWETERKVTTASVDQVRKPIYTSSVGRWKPYAEFLGPLRDTLATAGVPVPEQSD